VINEGILLQFSELVNILLLKTLQNKTIYLADIPLNYYKFLLADAFNLSSLNEIYREILNTIVHFGKFGIKNDLFETFFMFYGQIAQMPRDIHLFENLRKIRENDKENEVSIYVEMPHLNSFLKYYKTMKNEKNWEKLNEKVLIGKKTNEFVEKIAILDILFESKGNTVVNGRMKEFLEGNSINFKENYGNCFNKYSEIKKNLLN